MRDPSDAEITAAAYRAVSHWAIAAPEITLVARVENCVFKVIGGDGKQYVLRFHRPGYHTLEELESEQLWTEALTEAGLGVPLRQAAKDRRRYIQEPVGTPSTLYYVGISQWLEGEPMWDLIDNASRAEERINHFFKLGELAARIHNQATTWAAPARFSRHHLDADGFLGEQPWWGRFWESPLFSKAQQELLVPMRQDLYRILAGMARSNNEYSLIHADLHPGNVLVDGDRLHIIDFDDAGFGWHAYELAVALSPYQELADYQSIEDALLRGYYRHRPQAEGIAASIPLFFLIRALAQIGWAYQRPELELEANDIKRVSRVFELADTVLASGQT